MNNEETRVLDHKQTEKTNAKILEKKLNNSEKMAYVAGGFVAGVASGVVGSTYAPSPIEDKILGTEEVINVQQETVMPVQEEPMFVATDSVPNPEEVLLATDEGMRVAQVNDDASFAEAFADARAQVGAGGTFEWRGHVYSTYYEEEWNNMSADERANYQSKIDYETVTGETVTSNSTMGATPEEVPVVKHTGETIVDETSTNNPPRSASLEEGSKIGSMNETVNGESVTGNPTTTITSGEGSEVEPTPETAFEDTVTTEPTFAANAEMVDEQSAQGEIKVLGVEAVIDSQGNSMTIAAIEVDDEQALFVDVDNNGVMDVIMVDENYDEQISDNEIYDASDAGISTFDLQNHMAASQDSGMMMACDDGMPDYMNDADVSSMV